MIPTLIFSKDRACQLDLLLRSMERNAEPLTPVTVLWTASDLLYEDGYARCKSAHPDVVWWKEDAHFKDDVLAWLKTSDNLASFLVDDDVVYRPLGAGILVALADEQVLAFCPRLGANTTLCYPLNTAQKVPSYKERDVFVTWAWQQAECDFGYPGSLDGNVFRASDILPIVESYGFTNPNELEDVLAQWFNWNMADARPMLASYRESAVVNNPANIVNVSHPNRRAVTLLQPQYELNRRYLAGERIDLDLLDFTGVNAAHFEMKYVLR